MSNLLGDFFTGSTMLGADPDLLTGGPWTARITGKTTFVQPKLSVSPRLSGTVVGRTRLTGLLYQAPTGAHLSATIVGSTILTATMTSLPQVHFAATITGRTRFSLALLSHEVQLAFQGTVGAATARSLLVHGQVLSGTGVVKLIPYEDERQPVHFFV